MQRRPPAALKGSEGPLTTWRKGIGWGVAEKEELLEVEVSFGEEEERER